MDFATTAERSNMISAPEAIAMSVDSTPDMRGNSLMMGVKPAFNGSKRDWTNADQQPKSLQKILPRNEATRASPRNENLPEVHLSDRTDQPRKNDQKNKGGHAMILHIGDLSIPCGLDYFKTTYGILSLIGSAIAGLVTAFWWD